MGLSETGKYSASAEKLSNEIISDELSVIVGSTESGSASLLVGFIDAVRHLSEFRIRTNESRQRLELLEASCLFDNVLLAAGESCAGGWLRMDGTAPFAAVERYVEAKNGRQAHLLDRTLHRYSARGIIMEIPSVRRMYIPIWKC